MELIALVNGYRDYLLKNHSKITVKNYLSDINHFTLWFAKNAGKEFLPDLLSKTTLSDYQNHLGNEQIADSPKYSYKSQQRHLSSLRSFISYLEKQGLIEENPLSLAQEAEIVDPWRLKDFKNYLFENSLSQLTAKYYINDIQSFASWHKEAIGESPNGIPLLNSDIIKEYSERLYSNLSLSPKSINRKLSSIRKYLDYMAARGIDEVPNITAPNIDTKASEAVAIAELAVPDIEPKKYSRIPPIRLVQKISSPYFSFENKAADLLSHQIVKTKLRHAFQKSANTPQSIDKIIRGLSHENIKKEFYAPYEISTSNFPLIKKVRHHLRYSRPEWYRKYHNYTFVHYIHVGVLILFTAGMGVFAYHQILGNAKADTTLQATQGLNRTFVFKGRLLGPGGKPVTQDTDIRLSLYDSPTASGSALSWQEVQTNVKPDQDGNVTLIIGGRNPIPNDIFSKNIPLFLGITVGDGQELSPRQQIGVPYSENSRSVQGMEPITSSDRQTNVLLALDASGTLSIGGKANPVFRATGGEFTISGNTLLLTTNTGSNGDVVIDPHGNGKIDLTHAIINSRGDVIVEGTTVLSATDSARAAIVIRQDGSGPIFEGQNVGESRFIVDNQGAVTRGKWAGEPIGTEFGGFGADISALGPGELLYSTSNSKYGHLAPGIAGQCLVSGGRAAPLWSSCGFLSQLNGLLSLTTSTMDFVIGGNSTSSAKFGFVNMNTGTPSFRVGSTLSINADNEIIADDTDLKIGSGNTRNVLLATAGGNVGVNNSSPQRNLDVSGSWGGSVDYYSDGAVTQTVTRTTKALIYDFEKNTGDSDNSYTTTYDIVGLPEVDGTFAYIYTKVSKDLTAGSQTQSITIKVNGTQVGTVSTLSTTLSSSVIKHYTITRSNSKWHIIGDPGNSDAADLAEWTGFIGDTPEAGSIMSISSNGALEKSHVAYDSKIAGIVSTNPRVAIGLQKTNTTPLALSGRVPAIVTSINGDIKSGDNITASPIRGSGMRLTRGGATVGRAIESFNPTEDRCPSYAYSQIHWPNDTGVNENRPCFKVPISTLPDDLREELQEYGYTNVDYLYIGKIMVLSQVSWSNSDDLLASIDHATIENYKTPLSSLDTTLANQIEELDTKTPIVKVNGKYVEALAAFSGVVAGKVKAATILATNIVSENIYAAGATISNLTVSDKLTAKEINSPLIAADTIKTDSIKPNNSSNVSIDLPSSESALLVKNTNKNTEVARIDASGNASFSGEVTSNSLNTTEASIAGTLRAGRLIADDISGLDSKVATLASQILASSKPVENKPLGSSISADFGTFYQGLLSLGASTFGNLSVMDQLSIGTTFTLSQNSINTLGTELSIQPLRQGSVSFLAGLVRIEEDGRLTVSEDALFMKNLAVKGKVLTDVISPLSGDEDLSINLSSSKDHNSSLTVKNASNSAVLSINQKGDIISSGSATFSKFNLSLIQKAEAASLTTATATASAGTAILKANTNELTITNPRITSDSLIYITPAQNTNNNVLYLMRQTAEDTNTQDIEGSFTVGISQAAQQDVLFNWLIVN